MLDNTNTNQEQDARADATGDLLSALQNTTMLAALRSSALGLRRQDKQTSMEVARANNAADNAVATSINRLAGADTLHKEIIGLQADARQTFNSMTSTWDDDGWRLLPASLFQPLVVAMRPHMDKMAALKERLRAEAPMILARVDLGGLAGRVKLPTADEMVRAYSMRTEFGPIPDGASLHANVPAATLQRLREHIEERVRGKAAEALLVPARRCAEALSNMVARIKAYDQRLEDHAAGKDVGKSGVFRDSLVEHVQDVAKILDAFNVLGDPVFGAIVASTRAIVDGLTAEKLRADAGLRANTLTAAEEVLTRLREYGA